MAKIKYNAPVVLTFALLSVAVLIVDQLSPFNLRGYFFAAPSRTDFVLTNPITWLRLISHVFGHAGWAHLTGNFFLILLIGPLLEEKYGAKRLAGMILCTALATGVVNALFMQTSLMGASGIVFMMILLSGFTDFRDGEIPLTFVLVAMIYLLGEIVAVFRDDNISQLAHILGGVAGAVFGFRFNGLKNSIL